MWGVRLKIRGLKSSEGPWWVAQWRWVLPEEIVMMNSSEGEGGGGTGALVGVVKFEFMIEFLFASVRRAAIYLFFDVV